MTDIEKILKFVGFAYNGEGWHCIGTPYHSDEPPPLDMNFFFEHVRPKLRKLGYVAQIAMFSNYDLVGFNISARSKSIGEMGKCVSTGTNQDPNQAWQEAVLKLMEE